VKWKLLSLKSSIYNLLAKLLKQHDTWLRIRVRFFTNFLLHAMCACTK